MSLPEAAPTSLSALSPAIQEKIRPSNCVQIVVDDAGYFGGKGKIWYVYNDKYSGQQYVFSTDEVLHMSSGVSFIPSGTGRIFPVFFVPAPYISKA